MTWNFQTIYAAVMHVLGVIATSVLMATGHLDMTTGMTILGGLIGFALGLPVQTGTTTATVATPVATVSVTPPAVTPPAA